MPEDQTLSRKAHFQILNRRIEAAEAVLAVLKAAHQVPCGDEHCALCRRLARWAEARAIHEVTELPKPLAREKKRDQYAAAVAVRLDAAEVIVEQEAKAHWGRCAEECRMCVLIGEWRDARVVHEAVLTRASEGAA